MENEQYQQERRKQSVLRRLGTDDPRCAICGESDWRCLERHHLAGQVYDDLGVILCRNCHRKVSAPHENAAAPIDPPLLERIGHLLLGLAKLAELIVPKLREIGAELIRAAGQCPRPWGWGP
jgi:hypothetical protein